MEEFSHELRIGSLVNSFKGVGNHEDSFDEPYVVTVTPEIINEVVIFEDEVKGEAEYSGDGLYYNPIHATPEWLVKLGYKPLGKYSFVKDGLILHARKRGIVLKKSVPILKYVHQVQNMHLCMTGKEIKP